MSLGAALVAGGALGVRHALESDHVAAVATLSRERRGGRGVAEARAGAGAGAGAGAWWGVGHGVPIALVGLSVLLAGVRLPGGVTHAFEAAAGLVLVALGGWTLLDVLQPRLRRHAHDGGGRAHPHVALGDQLLGLGHRHVDAGAFAVGLVHGLAGSGAVVVALIAAAPTPGEGAAFLGAFVAATVLAMSTAGGLWRRVDGTAFRRPLRTVAGVAALGIGLAMIAPFVGAL